MKRIVALCLAAFLIAPSAASAQDADIQTTINVVRAFPSYSGCGDPQYNFDDIACSEIVQQPALPPFQGGNFIFVVYSREPGGYPGGIGAGQFGMVHDLGALNWSLCTGGAEIPQDDFGGAWPASGTGNAVTWGGGCYVPAGENAKVGFFPLSISDVGNVQIIGDPRANPTEGLYTDCVPFLFRVPAFNLGGLALSNVQQEDTLCGAQGVPTVEQSWSSLKSLF